MTTAAAPVAVAVAAAVVGAEVGLAVVALAVALQVAVVMVAVAPQLPAAASLKLADALGPLLLAVALRWVLVGRCSGAAEKQRKAGPWGSAPPLTAL
mmetsp:Transcript_36823/g.85590  ORF Transcript_36823/g.85590 Transcript_36823/m.85590 type:complete len:97 (+) Transcript_36823:680-970(+)